MVIMASKRGFRLMFIWLLVFILQGWLKVALTTVARSKWITFFQSRAKLSILEDTNLFIFGNLSIYSHANSMVMLCQKLYLRYAFLRGEARCYGFLSMIRTIDEPVPERSDVIRHRKDMKKILIKDTEILRIMESNPMRAMIKLNESSEGVSSDKMI